MKIGTVAIGPAEPTYIVAEIGGNHDGSLDRALELVDVAASAGADAAKFQLFRGDKLYPGRFTPGAIEDAWLPVLKRACHEAGIEFLCSVFCRETLDAYMAVQPAAVKIASPEAKDRVLLTAAARYDKPLIVSTGAMTVSEVDRLWIFLQDEARDFALLHCVSSYPPPDAELNLRAISDDPDDPDPDVPVGFSDHSLDPVLVPALAVACGAAIIEKHLTYSRDAEGADHPFALEPAEFERMVETIRRAEVVLGDGRKRVMPSEDATDRRAA